MDNRLKEIFKNLISKYIRAKDFNIDVGNTIMAEYMQTKIDTANEIKELLEVDNES